MQARELPSGTVTFLFTDIEGSTKLLHALGRERYATVLTEHQRLLREVWRRHAGHEVDTEGDAFLVAFARASQALAAAADAQRTLAMQAWSDGQTLRVRIGVHSGEATHAGGKYVGVAVHRGARICAAAHGGQILVSQTTRELAADEELSDLTYRDLGEHRLKDLTHAQRLYQLSGEGLEREFPPPKTLENRPTNLPVQPTPFLGRERELGEVKELLLRNDVRLLTLTGPGGTGKTRLALQLAAELVERFPNGVFLVTLAPVTDPELVLPTIAQTLGVREQPGHPLGETLQADLREKELLLLLDNFEQVEAACSDVAALLESSRHLKVVVTSRAPLHVAAEHEYAVSPLAEEQAVELFFERAQAVKASFELERNRSTVVEICRRLDYLPLAVELAAARVKLLPPPALLGRLDERLKLLTGGARDRDERQRTLRGAIDWSYALLSEEEKLLFRRLAVFAGGWTLEAAEEVCAPEGEIDVLDGLGSLLDKSLIRQSAEGDEPRFAMLETIREYAFDQLRLCGEDETQRTRHADHYLRRAERENDAYLGGGDQRAGTQWFLQEEANLREAFDWAVRRRDSDAALRFVWALWRFWANRGLFRQARAMCDAALALDGSATSLARGRALAAASEIARFQGDVARARAEKEEAAPLLRQAGEPGWVAAIMNDLGDMLANEGELEKAEALHRESLEIRRQAGQERSSRATWSLGYVCMLRGDYGEARGYFEEALEIDRVAEMEENIAATLETLAESVRREGDVARARELFREAMEIWMGLGALPAASDILNGVGKIAAAEGELRHAARLWGAAERLCRQSGYASPFQAEQDEALRQARDALGPEELERALEEGRTMSDEEIVAAVLHSDDSERG